jgi:cystathionine beta-lyase/cystathionine gamma-synthase
VYPSEEEVGVDHILAHLGEDDKPFGAVVPPIFQNSLFVYDKTEDLMAAMAGDWEGPPYFYSKISNPTVQVAERKIAALEGVEIAKVTSGGIGAIAVALASELESGAHAVIVESAYGPARSFLNYLGRFGVTYTLVEGGNTQEVLDAIRPESRVIYLESPSSLLFRMQDIPEITKVAREKKITTFFDNTYNTPLHMKPAEFGIDIVLHSASKYLGGHSDINAGAICTDRARMDKIVRNEIGHFANLLHPFSAWLLLRGMRTLKVRLAQHEIAANNVATWLSNQEGVEYVHHISLPDYPQRDLYLKLMSGSGGIFSFEPSNQERSAVIAFCDALKIFERGISWGGFESLVVPTFTKTIDSSEPKWLIRLFCGLEDPEELRKDVANALVHVR